MKTLQNSDRIALVFQFEKKRWKRRWALFKVSMKVLWLRRWPPKGARYCDFLEVLRFLDIFRRGAKNIYQIYHGSLRFDTKKVYRYLRYCININLIELDHIEEDRFFPAKYYRLTDKGRALIELFSGLPKK